MRVFKQYLPLLIAKYVKTYYQGHIYIQDCGQLEFQHGKVLMPSFNYQRMPEQQKGAVKLLQGRVREINDIIANTLKQAA